MAVQLMSTDIRSVSNATDQFGENKGLLICRPGRNAFKPFFTINSGYYALVTDHGADVNFQGKAVWPAGFHWGAPWRKVSNLVTKQSVVFDMPVKGCKTADNVSVEIDVAIVFRIMGDVDKGEDPDLVRKFVHEVGPRGLEQQLRGAQEEAVRAIARSMEHTQVYGLRTGGSKGAAELGAMAAMVTGEEKGAEEGAEEGGMEIHGAAILHGGHDDAEARRALINNDKGSAICEAMKIRLNKQFMAQGVEVTSVIIKNVKLPSNICEAMSNKTMVISENNEQKMNQLSDMQQVRYGEEIETLNQKHKEEREEESQRGEQDCSEVTIKLNDTRSLAAKSLKLIAEESDVGIKNIVADSDLQVSRLVNSRDAYASSMKAKSETEEARVRAGTAKYSVVKEAEANLQQANNEAAAAKILAEAEGKLAHMVVAKKTYETEMRRLEVAAALASNPELVISGSDNEEMNAMMMCDAVLGNVRPGQNITRSQVLSELVMLQKGSRVYLNGNNPVDQGA